MPKEHLIVARNKDGKVDFYPMKQWLRDNLSSVPQGLDPTEDTSHTLRAALRRDGWLMKERGGKVLLIKPEEGDDFSYADPLIANIPELEDENGEEDILEAEEITFGLERDLQQALRANIAQLEPGLTIIDGGKEKVTEAGRIDITASDKNDEVVVIELKAGRANPESVAQILSYMGSIAGTEDKAVRGILVAGDFHKRVILACRAIPNVRLKQYSFQFAFSEVT